MKSLAMLLAVLSATTAASVARADDVPAPEETPAAPAADAHKAMWRFELGYRGAFVTSPGYGPFSTDDYFSQVSVAASRTVLVRGRFSFAPGLAWDYGTTSATARGDITSLTMHRLGVPLEGRMHVARLGYAFVRVAPGVVLTAAEVQDPSAPAALSKNRWLMAADASAGYAWLAWSRPEGPGPMARLWLQGEAGYGWVATERLDLAPDLASGSSQRASGADLGALAMRGVFFRAAAAVSF